MDNPIQPVVRCNRVAIRDLLHELPETLTLLTHQHLRRIAPDSPSYRIFPIMVTISTSGIKGAGGVAKRVGEGVDNADITMSEQGNWEPISESEFYRRLHKDLSTLSDDHRVFWDRFRVTPHRASIIRGEDGVEHVWVVARKESLVLYFDDIEEEWATGTIDGGVISIADYGMYNNLSHAMSCIGYEPPG